MKKERAIVNSLVLKPSMAVTYLHGGSTFASCMQSTVKQQSKVSLSNRQMQSSRAGIVFPVGRIGRYMRMKNYAPRISADAPVFMAAVMEYLCAEIIEVVGEVCQDLNKKIIKPRHFELAIRSDKELNRLFQNTTFIQAGSYPYINFEIPIEQIMKETQ